eukprot:COSAG02_NODE_390_length_23244_cov_35.504558_21_plen_173_part_00
MSCRLFCLDQRQTLGNMCLSDCLLHRSVTLYTVPIGISVLPSFTSPAILEDGTGDNSSENSTRHEFFSPIFSLGPSRIQRCTVHLFTIVGSSCGGQTPRACEVRSTEGICRDVGAGPGCGEPKISSRKSSIRAGRLQKTTNFRSFWGWLTLLTLFIHALISVPHRDSHSAWR